MPLFRGEYEPHLFKLFSETLKPGMVFMDIGANIGFYSMLAASRVGEGGKVISFDPNTENCRLLMLSINKNGFNNVSLYPFALGGKSGYAMFSTHIGSNGGLIPDTEDSLVNPNCVIVPITRLDDLIDEKVDLIKIDVEGAEGLVIEGAKKLIEKHRPIITSEFSLEMLPRVSGMSGKEYLGYFRDQDYATYICERQTQELVAIESVDAFVNGYGEVTRIEDLVFMPV
jgi:FkbM family methyltransferase